MTLIHIYIYIYIYIPGWYCLISFISYVSGTNESLDNIERKVYVLREGIYLFGQRNS